MNKHFYSHIITIESLIIELDELDLSPTQKYHLSTLIDSSLHNVILDAILSELSDEDKRIFINHLSLGNHDKIWNLLNQKVDNVEEKITKAAEDLKIELHKDIKESQKLKRGKVS